ncbi:hypothetical protein V2J09_004939 [Rumex salicifolius]
MEEIEPQNGYVNTAKSTPAAAVAFSSFKPQLAVEASKASDAVQFYKSAFGAEELRRTTLPKRKADQELPSLLSVDLKIASSVFSVSSSSDEYALQSTGFQFCLETEDIEGAIAKSVSAGASAVGEVVEVAAACNGGRMGMVMDPYGYVWMICSATKTSDAAAVEA